METRYPMRKTYVVRVGGQRYGSIQHVPEWEGAEETKARADAYLADVIDYFAKHPATLIQMTETVEPDAYLRGQDYVSAYDR
jgi:hypothetical protein